MTWLIVILLIVCLFLCWLLFSPLELDIDTRKANAALRWWSIGSVSVWYDEEWWLGIRVFFYRKIMPVSKMKATPKKAKKATKNNKPKRKPAMARMLRKTIRAVRTFRVVEWKIAIDCGDYAANAQLYPLNFLPSAPGHLYVNFNDENFLVVKIRNSAWRVLYALLR